MSLIAIKQAAEILGVSKRTLMRWDKDGRFKPESRQQFSRYRLYDREKVKGLKINIIYFYLHRKSNFRRLYL